MTPRLLYHLPLRQAEGFLDALFRMMRLDLSVPDYTTLSAQSAAEAPSATGPARRGPPSRARQHGSVHRRGRRGWRKLHLGVDQSGVILLHTLTEATGEDATTALDLLNAVEGPLVRVTADAAYDTVARAGSDDHVGEAARPAPLEEGVRVTIVRAGWRMRSSDTSPSSEMAFAPGVQLAGERGRPRL